MYPPTLALRAFAVGVCMVVLIVAGCTEPGQPEAASATYAPEAQPAVLLRRLCQYKNLDLSPAKIHRQQADGGFLRVEYPENTDSWADMMSLADAAGTPLVVYLATECEPACGQQLYVYAYRNHRFEDASQQYLPPALKSRVLQGKADLSKAPLNVGFRLQPGQGQIALYLYAEGDERLYETMDVQGRRVGSLVFTGKAYQLAEE